MALIKKTNSGVEITGAYSKEVADKLYKLFNEHKPDRVILSRTEQGYAIEAIPEINKATVWLIQQNADIHNVN